MMGTDEIWDVSRFSLTSPGLSAECPNCSGYLHSYASRCFGCDYERGSAYLELLGQWRTVANAPIPELLRSEYLADAARVASGSCWKSRDGAGSFAPID
jgi:hypothetical protein